MSVIFTGISVTSLADVDAVCSWIQEWQIEPYWISLADRPNVVASGNIVFSTERPFYDGAKWDVHTRKVLETKGERTFRVISGFPNEANRTMKRYSATLDHHGRKCSLVAYIPDGDNLPSASLISPLPFPSKYHLAKRLSDLPSSAMEHVKSAVETLALEMRINVPMFVDLIIPVVFGRGFGNVETMGGHQQGRGDTPRTGRRMRQRDGPGDPSGSGGGKRKCDVLDEATQAKKKRDFSWAASEVDKKSRFVSPSHHDTLQLPDPSHSPNGLPTSASNNALFRSLAATTSSADIMAAASAWTRNVADEGPSDGMGWSSKSYYQNPLANVSRSSVASRPVQSTQVVDSRTRNNKSHDGLSEGADLPYIIHGRPHGDSESLAAPAGADRAERSADWGPRAFQNDYPPELVAGDLAYNVGAPSSAGMGVTRLTIPVDSTADPSGYRLLPPGTPWLPPGDPWLPLLPITQHYYSYSQGPFLETAPVPDTNGFYMNGL